MFGAQLDREVVSLREEVSDATTDLRDDMLDLRAAVNEGTASVRALQFANLGMAVAGVAAFVVHYTQQK